MQGVQCKFFKEQMKQNKTLMKIYIAKFYSTHTLMKSEYEHFRTHMHDEV
jgi:hypothetical protein